MLLNGDIHDIASNAFDGPYAADPWLKLQDYDTFVHTLAEDGTCSGMLTVLALSTVTQTAIQTIWPVGVVPGSQSSLTKHTIMSMKQHASFSTIMVSIVCGKILMVRQVLFHWSHHLKVLTSILLGSICRDCGVTQTIKDVFPLLHKTKPLL